MEINVDRNILYKTISLVQGVLEKKTNMPILSSILITTKDDGLIKISATDLQIWLEQTIPAEVIESGSITISGRKIFEILRESISESFTIRSEKNNTVFLSDGNAKFNLSSYSAEEYPEIVKPEDVELIELDSDIIYDMAKKTVTSIAKESEAPKLAGVFTEWFCEDNNVFLRMVSTDTHRMSIVERPVKKREDIESISFEKGIVIPRKGLVELMRMASDGDKISLGFNEKFCVAKKDDLLLILMLLESRFPDYRRIIPDKNHQTLITFDRDTMISAMKRMLILASDQYYAVKVCLRQGSMELVSTNPEIGEGEEDIKINYEGDDMDIFFNPKYFIDMLQSMDSEDIYMGITKEAIPIVLTGKRDEGFMGIIMPMRY